MSPRHPVSLYFGLVVVTTAVAFATHWPYWAIVHFFDDVRHLHYAAMWHRGEISAIDYLFTPFNYHVLPLWKLSYYVQWRLFGTEQWYWHLVISVCHVVGAVSLFILGRIYFSRTAAAALAAVLWAGATIGRLDNPLSWIAASHFTLATTLALVAMASVAVWSTNGQRRWIWLGIAAAAAMVLAMGSMAVWIPFFWIQSRYLAPIGGRQADAAPLRPADLLSAGLLFGLLIGLQAAALEYARYRAQSGELTGPLEAWARPVEHGSLTLSKAPAGLSRLVRCYRGAFAGLVLPPKSSLPAKHPLEDIAAMVSAVVLVIVFWPAKAAAGFKQSQRYVLFLFAFTALPAGLAMTLQPGLGDEELMLSWRHRYIPTLFWCVALAATMERVLEHATRGAAKWVVSAAIALAIWSLWVQRETAAKTRAICEHDIAFINTASGDIDAGIKGHHRALEWDGKFIASYEQLARIHGQKGDFDTALRFNDTALELEPDNLSSLQLRAELLREAGQGDDARSLANEILRQNPDDARALYVLARISLGERNWHSASVALSQVIRLQPDWHEPANDYAWLLATAPDANVRSGAKAVEFALRATEQGRSESPELLDTFAAAYAEAGLFAEAITVAHRAVQRADDQRQPLLAAQIRQRLAQYESGRPHRAE